MDGRCFVGPYCFWLSKGCLEGVLKVSETCLEGVWKVSGRCLLGVGGRVSQALPRAWADVSGSSQSLGRRLRLILRLRLFPELGWTAQALPKARADVSGSSQSSG